MQLLAEDTGLSLIMAMERLIRALNDMTDAINSGIISQICPNVTTDKNIVMGIIPTPGEAKEKNKRCGRFWTMQKKRAGQEG